MVVVGVKHKRIKHILEAIYLLLTKGVSQVELPLEKVLMLAEDIKKEIKKHGTK